MQLSDKEDIFEKSRRIQKGVLKNMLEASGPRHDAVDVVRTALWYASVEQRLRGATAYEVEKLIEPEAFGKNQYGDRYHRNKWSGYRVGRHKPNARLIERVEKYAPGSAILINHLLWDVIRKKKKLKWFNEVGLKQLSNDIRSILFKADRYGLNEKLVSKLTARHHRQLERRSGFDALAAQSVFLWQADIQNDRIQALAIGESIYRILLILSTYFPFAVLRNEILSLFNAYVFPMAHNGSVGIGLNNAELFRMSSDLLNMLYLELEDEGIGDGSPKQSMKIMTEVLYGDWGEVVQVALSPPVGLVVPESLASAKDKEAVVSRERARKAAWDKLQA